ncbi:MAG: YCF48-related protein, partial [Bacteroidota bacterium]|nr:YCF48-related protein [Bacteroidota bacterium]
MKFGRKIKYLIIYLSLILFCTIGCKKSGPVDGGGNDDNNNCEPIETPPGVWQLLGLEIETVTAIAVHPTNPCIIYAGSAFDFSAGKLGYLFKTTNSGKSWDTLIRGGSYIDIVLDPSNPEIIYAVPYSLLKSTNGGLTWRPIMNGIRIDWETRVGSFALDTRNTNIMYAGTGGFYGGRFYKSTDGGENWRDISRDSLHDGVINIAIDPNNSNILYAGTPWRGILWKTTDAGETWFRTGLGETSSMIDAVAVSPFNSNIVYARVRFMGLYKSNDGGTTWDKTQIPDSIGVFTILFSKLRPSFIYL